MIHGHTRSILVLLITIGSFLPAYGSATMSHPAKAQDAFAWQNEKQFTEIVTRFSAYAEQEFADIVTWIRKEIRSSESFFRKSHSLLIQHFQETIYDWMQNDVLSVKAYQEYLSTLQEDSASSEETYDSDEDPWRVAHIRGYEADSDDERADDEEGDDHLEETSEESSLHYDESELELWRVETIDKTLGLSISQTEEFIIDSIDLNAIELFLKKSVEGGWSWLVNETVCGTLCINESFAFVLSQRSHIPRAILEGIFEGLWVSYDWEQFDIKDPLYIAKTFEGAIRALQTGRENELKQRLIRSLVALFSFNEQDFKEPLSQIRNTYKEYVARHDWLGALIEWSIYCVYRKVCKTLEKKEQSMLKACMQFNKKAHVLQQMEKTRTRALASYKKVYLHVDTTKLVYVDTKGKRGELQCINRFKRLQSIGTLYEKKRPRGPENIFVPELYIIVQQQGSSDALPHFIKLPLKNEALDLPARPLTRAVKDTVFKEGDQEYFAQVRKDYVKGRKAQRASEAEAECEIETIIINPVGCKTDLIHSERVLMELLRNPSYIRHIVEILAGKCQKGTYRVHSLVMLGYSTNSICAQCTPTLIALMNSHEPGEFLHMLVDELTKYARAVRFSVPTSCTATDWRHLRMNIFVTASKPFANDKQACDLHRKDEKEPAIPHAHLYLPNNEFVLSDVPCLKNGTEDEYQRFFYEFVAADSHRGENRENTSSKVVCSSGSTSWSLPA